MRWGLVSFLVCMLVVAHARADDVPISDGAREAFKRGVVLLTESKDYAGAYAAFQAAFAESPSPKILGNLGLSAMHLERDGEAIEAYERYLAEAGAVSDVEHRQIIEDLVKLRGRVARIDLTIRPLIATVIDERSRADGPPVVNRYEVGEGSLRIGVREGRHRFTILADGYQSQVWEIDAKRRVPSRATIELSKLSTAVPSLELPPERADIEPESGFPSTGFTIAAAVTGACGIGTIVLGSLALANKSDFEDAVDTGNLASAESLRDDGRKLNVASDVFLTATVVGAAATAVFLIMDLTGGDGADSGLVVAPYAGPDAAGLALGGPF